MRERNEGIESVAPLLLDTSKDTYLVDDITFTRVPIDKEGGVSRAMANYQVLVCFDGVFDE